MLFNLYELRTIRSVLEKKITSCQFVLNKKRGEIDVKAYEGIKKAIDKYADLVIKIDNHLAKSKE